jgi:hypothetical protein
LVTFLGISGAINIPVLRRYFSKMLKLRMGNFRPKNCYFCSPMQ